MASRDDNVYLAKLAEQAERYEEMVKYMKEVANDSSKTGEDLTVEERNLLSVAFKNVIGSRRAAWRVLSSPGLTETADDAGPEGKEGDIRADRVNAYKKVVENELDDICDDILQVIDEHLIPTAKGAESKVFYLKMAGDYYRYLAEFKNNDDKNDCSTQASEKYKEATNVAGGKTSEGEDDPDNKGLPPTHPIRLGLALNYSVFFYEILNKPDKACVIAKSAFDEAISELDSLEEESYKDATLIMQLLRDNLTLWTSDAEMDDN